MAFMQDGGQNSVHPWYENTRAVFVNVEEKLCVRKRIPGLHREYVFSHWESLWICQMQVDVLEQRILHVTVSDSLEEVV